MDFEVRTEQREGVVVLTATGELDAYTAPVLDQVAADTADGRPRVVIDLTGLTFLDSTGLRVLVGVRGRLPEPGQLRVVVGDQRIERLFALAGMYDLFELYPTLDAALRG